MFSRCFPLALLRVLFGWADLAIASHFHSRGGCGGALSARAAPNTFSLHLPALPPVAYSSLPRSWEQFKMQNSQFTIMASISRRLFLIRKTLRPGPARAESATPAAGPGEHLNEFPKGNDSMQRQHCHSEEIGRSTKNLYKSIRRQILDCTAFVFLFLARHSPQAAAAFVDSLRSE